MSKAALLAAAAAAALLLSAAEARAQLDFAVSTNVVEWFVKGGANAGAHLSFTRNLSVDAEALCRLGSVGQRRGYRGVSFYTGARWWPWSAFSGFYAGGGFKYSRANDYVTHDAVDRARTGMALRAGYDILLFRHFNLELGAGAWGGRETVYEELEELKASHGWFWGLDEIRAGIVYIF